jgi:hypothetical protein
MVFGTADLNRERSKCVLVLLAASANASAPACGVTPCVSAAFSRRQDTLAELIAAGADFDAVDKTGATVRRALRHVCATDKVEAARRRIEGARLDLVRNRAFQVCVGLQALRRLGGELFLGRGEWSPLLLMRSFIFSAITRVVFLTD